MANSYEKFYNTEEYLFNEVQKCYEKNKKLNARDFFCILIWKANRAKGYHADRLLELYPESDLEKISEKVTTEIYTAKENPEKQLRILIETYKFLLPTASAILSVLHPSNFSVYDYRVCGELEDLAKQSGVIKPQNFKKLANVTVFDKIWKAYQEYLVAVTHFSKKDDFREADKYLWGRSFYRDLERDIANKFKKQTTP